MRPPARFAALVLVAPDGSCLGALAPVPVTTPWWPETAPIVAAVRDRYGIEVTVLRLLEADRDSPPGGTVTYLAQTSDLVDGLRPFSSSLDDHPLRMPWAMPGGPQADIAWADRVLADRGIGRSGPAEQIRSWNLSSLWRLPIQGGGTPGQGGAVWLKHVPAFFAHEAAVIQALAGWPVPTLLAADGQRMLLREIPGVDHHDAGPEVLAPAVTTLVRMQASWASRVDALRAMGLPDWRPGPLTEAIEAVIARTATDLPPADRRSLEAFTDRLPDRWQQIDACGIPDSLVHGDFSPGNLRGDGDPTVLLDWGDSGVGHPLLDQPAMLSRVPKAAVATLRDQWTSAWTSVIPGSDPHRAAELLEPIAAARQAVIYRRFLDQIEPSEHPYHRADPQQWLGRAAARFRDAQVRAASRPARA